MDQNLKKIIEMNKDYLSEEDLGKFHVTVIGQYVKDAEGESKPDFAFETNNNQMLLDHNLPNQKYYRCSFFQIEEVDGAIELSRRPVFDNVFERDTILFDWINKQIQEGHYVKMTDYKSRSQNEALGIDVGSVMPQIQLKGVLKGQNVPFRFPPHWAVVNGRKLTGIVYVPETASYKVTEGVPLTSRRVFCIKGDDRLQILTRVSNRFVIPYLVKEPESGAETDYGLEDGQVSAEQPATTAASQSKSATLLPTGTDD